MATVNCQNFHDTIARIDAARRRIRAEERAGKERLSEIASEIRRIRQEIARLMSNLNFLNQFRPRGRRRPSDDLDDAQRLLSFEDARRRIRELEDQQRALDGEADGIRRKLERVEPRMDELRREELTNRDLARAAGCWR